MKSGDMTTWWFDPTAFSWLLDLPWWWLLQWSTSITTTTSVPIKWKDQIQGTRILHHLPKKKNRWPFSPKKLFPSHLLSWNWIPPVLSWPYPLAVLPLTVSPIVFLKRIDLVFIRVGPVASWRVWKYPCVKEAVTAVSFTEKTPNFDLERFFNYPYLVG